MHNRYMAWIAGLLALAVGFGLARLRQTHEPPEAAPGDRVPTQAAGASPAHPSTQWQQLVAKSSTHSTARHSGSQSPDAMAPLPAGPFGASVKQLEQLARAGNASAAAALAKGLRSCEFFQPAANAQEAMQRVEERSAQGLAFLDQVAEHVRQSAAEQGRHVDIPLPSTREVMQGELATQRDDTERCTGVDADAARDWPQWLKRAAQLGDLDAELSYWKLVIQHADVTTPEELVTDKRTALATLQHALDRGDSRALAAIGKTLALGMFAEPDAYSAYAYLYAASQAPPAESKSLPWIELSGGLFIRRGTQDYFAQELRELEASLSVAQRLDAEQAGLQLYRQCCSGSAR